MRLKFIHSPFKDKTNPHDWIYGRGTVGASDWDKGKNIYAFRGALDGIKEDIQEVIKREESANPDKE